MPNFIEMPSTIYLNGPSSLTSPVADLTGKKKQCLSLFPLKNACLEKC